jgi:hypothetical protein
VMSVSHFALSGYWRGNPGLMTVARGCSLLRVTVRLHSDGHTSLIVTEHTEGTTVNGFCHRQVTRSTFPHRNYRMIQKSVKRDSFKLYSLGKLTFFFRLTDFWAILYISIEDNCPLGRCAVQSGRY